MYVKPGAEHQEGPPLPMPTPKILQPQLTNVVCWVKDVELLCYRCPDSHGGLPSSRFESSLVRIHLL